MAVCCPPLGAGCALSQIPTSPGCWVCSLELHICLWSDDLMTFTWRGKKCTKQNEGKKKKKKGEYLQNGRSEKYERQQAEQRPKSVQKTVTLRITNSVA